MYSSRNATILAILKDEESSVFRIADVAMLTGETKENNLVQRLRYWVKQGYLVSPCKGIYAKPNFSFEELACKLYVPSYISLDTVLYKEGIISQYAETVSSVSYLSRTISIGEKEIRYRKIKNDIIINFDGIIRGQINIATPERAFLDTLYLNPNYYFDNIERLNQDKIKALLPIYQSSTLNKRVKKWLT